MDVEYRWLTDDEIETQVNPVLRAQGWMELNLNSTQPTCRVVGAVEDGRVVGFEVLQLIPAVGPTYVEPERRDGTISRELTAWMSEFLHEIHARGWIVVADSPVTARLAERWGMRKLESPVYVAVGG